MKKNITLSVVFFILLIQLYAQINFSPMKNVSTSNYIHGFEINSVFSIDIDNDGDLDIISAFNNEILWHENNNKEYFILNNEIKHFGYIEVNSVIAFDVDMDGDNDVVFASIVGDRISWFENEDGNGSFGPEIIISPNANGAFCVVSADMDNDGWVDIIASLSHADKVVWFKSYGNGAFSDEIEIATEIDAARGIKASDINNDNNVDILITSYNGNHVYWYENNSNGSSFTGHQIDWLFDATAINACDIDNDSDIDIVAVGGNEVVLFENINYGDSFLKHSVNDEISNGYAVQIVDIDYDGDKDIVSGAGNFDRLMWYENTGGLDDFQKHYINSVSGSIKSVISIDIDTDGDIDIVAADRLHGVCLYKNSPNFSVFDNPILINQDTGSFRDIVISDFDGDDDADILVSHDDYIKIFYNYDGNGNFYSSKLVGESDGITQLFAEDLDNDGDMDIIVSGQGDWNTAWIENVDGNGNFGTSRTLASGSFPTSVSTFDFDNDGDKDVVSAFDYIDDVFLNENIGGENFFSDQVMLFENIELGHITTSDIDGDNYEDIVGGVSGQHEDLLWFKNHFGDGTFEPSEVISSLKWWIGFVKCVDIDSDGDIDVLSGSDSGYFLHINDDNIFTDVFLYEEAGTTKKKILPADFDDDGDLDLAFCNTYGSGSDIEGFVFIFEHDALGDFGEVHLIATLQYVKEIEVADFDGDGDEDILVSKGELYWYENLLPEGVETRNNNQLIVYPNPTNGIINLKFTKNNIKQIQVFDIVGKKIIEKTEINQNEMIDLSNFKNGIYIIKTQTGNEIFITKIVKR